MQKIIEDLKKELQNIRTDRATPALVENILVDYYGTKVTLKETASITTPEPRMIMIQPWDKEAITNIESALSDYNPKSDGQIIRINLPALTDERKQELEKQIGQLSEQARIKIRQERDKQREEIKQIKDEDEKFRKLKELDEQTEEFNKKIEEIKNKKIQETCS